MGDLTINFSRSEFACKCGCGFDVVDFELLNVLQGIRYTYGRPIIITSGCRCRAYNSSVQGARDSQHCYGKAADIVVDGVEPVKVYDYLSSIFEDRYGIGKYDNWTHLDVRDKKARW